MAVASNGRQSEMAFPEVLAERLSYARRSVNNTERQLRPDSPAKLQLSAGRCPGLTGSRAVLPHTLTQTLTERQERSIEESKDIKPRAAFKDNNFLKNATNTIANAVRFRSLRYFIHRHS